MQKKSHFKTGRVICWGLGDNTLETVCKLATETMQCEADDSTPTLADSSDPARCPGPTI